MEETELFAPYGGELIDLLVDTDRIELLKNIAGKLTDITLTDRQMCDLELLATGAFSPLRGFMVQSEYASVLDRMQLQSGLVWPMPICLDVGDLSARTLEAGQSVALRDAEGFLLAVMHIEDIFSVDKEKEAERVYGTLDPSHPGVDHLMNACGDTLYRRPHRDDPPSPSFRFSAAEDVSG